ncbi:unnamed protein product [Brachionus calyciflorus]|uniref:Uncharacterized protein n=1 Tax=Brachionus calyciflorus TaxID=104777 RepID=A0A814MSC7_9BILA|nr:unnamed protein product [Brachionus calyciflorus]
MSCRFEKLSNLDLLGELDGDELSIYMIIKNYNLDGKKLNRLKEDGLSLFFESERELLPKIELSATQSEVIPSYQYALSSPQANIEPIIEQPKSRKRNRQNEDSLLFEFPKQKVRKDVSTRLHD